MEKYKQVIVVRKDLKMNPGKTAAQVSHAAVAAVLGLGYRTGDSIIIPHGENDALRYWLDDEFTKVICRCDSSQELSDLYFEAIEAGLDAVLITDAGHTVFNGVPTDTCISIGPADIEEIDAITGHLKLL